jgi:hypothetical protein
MWILTVTIVEMTTEPKYQHNLVMETNCCESIFGKFTNTRRSLLIDYRMALGEVTAQYSMRFFLK